jgi:pilus assembly protein TadC
MKKINKCLYIAAFILLLVFYIIVNLYKGVAVRGGDPFSLNNVIKISLIFIIGIPIVILIQKLFFKDENKSADREDRDAHL